MSENLTDVALIFRLPGNTDNHQDWPNVDLCENINSPLCSRIKSSTNIEHVENLLGELMKEVETAQILENKKASLICWLRGLRRVE